MTEHWPTEYELHVVVLSCVAVVELVVEAQKNSFALHLVNEALVLRRIVRRRDVTRDDAVAWQHTGQTLSDAGHWQEEALADTLESNLQNER